jgi:hypothetical protein
MKAKTSMAGGKGADARKAMAPKPKKSSLKISAKSPLNSMSIGAAQAPQDPAAGLRMAGPGMKKGGMCAPKKMAGGGSCYAKGGMVSKSGIDGIAKKGRTSCKKV